MCNELSIEEKQRDACLIWTKMMFFFILMCVCVCFFRYDWEAYSKDYDVCTDPHTPRATSRLLLIITKSFKWQVDILKVVCSHSFTTQTIPSTPFYGQT